MSAAARAAGAPAGRLAGRVAVVTGGTIGIGRATCLALAREGAAVCLVGRRPERVEDALSELASLEGPTPALGLSLDARSEADMETMAARALDRFGRIDVLVAAAGILRPRGGTLKTLVHTTAEEWDEVIDINLKGVFLADRAVLPAMLRQRSGHILNVSSTSGRKAYAFDAAYCASKYGILGLTEALAEEVRQHGIRVQALLPGAIDTPMWSQNGPLRRPDYALPARRVADLALEMITLPEDARLPDPAVEALGKSALSGLGA